MSLQRVDSHSIGWIDFLELSILWDGTGGWGMKLPFSISTDIISRRLSRMVVLSILTFTSLLCIKQLTGGYQVKDILQQSLRELEV